MAGNKVHKLVQAVTHCAMAGRGKAKAPDSAADRFGPVPNIALYQ